MTLRGADISHWQNDAGLNLGAFLNSVDFVIVKATQGAGYVDPKFGVNMDAARRAGKLRGAYHFAGDNGRVPGDPVREADHFIDVVGHQPGEVLVLDYEPTKPPADPDGWCAAFICRVRDRTGVVPMLYMSEAVTRQGSWARTRALNVGLWVARYGPNTGAVPSLTLNVGAWGGFAMWQFTSSGRVSGARGTVDLNEFYGNAEAWGRYGGAAGGAAGGPAPAATPTPVRTANVLPAGSTLRPGEALTIAGWTAVMQTDGNFVVYANDGAQWATHTEGHPGSVLVMQTDGNLVVYAPDGRPLWSARANGKRGNALHMQPDGNLVIYRPDGHPVWARS